MEDPTKFRDSAALVVPWFATAAASKSGGWLGCGVHAPRAAAAATPRRRDGASRLAWAGVALSCQREDLARVAAAASSGVTLDELLPVRDRLRLLP
jgi:hypothetical protein